MGSKTEMRELTRAEVAEHNDSQSLWVIFQDKVYDLTKFITEHPGGEDVLVDEGGKDGTSSFEDIGHSSDAIELREQYLIGILAPAERKNKT